ncbi:hypothetical protein [Streptomyces sp. ST2-7A]|uniref:hypothetical protein n=1 Tax=Streptomyces sp. ST2-7A TaxID=2907214 RepID=UPI001F1B4FDF|nr:hypothetical protein [Streptomyces sp. ST2-7A]MCE7079100.1 hypothetical protein [Streptomyces sp. ST2-7A]
MGIEGEQLVLDYLSRVGDLAHTTGLSPTERRDLVTRLRADITRRRSEVQGDESRADVKRILKGVGRPEDVVAAAGERATAVPDPRPAAPEPAPEPAPAQAPAPASAQPPAPAAAQPPPVADAAPAPAEPRVPAVPATPAVPAGRPTARHPWADELPREYYGGHLPGMEGGFTDPEVTNPRPVDFTKPTDAVPGVPGAPEAVPGPRAEPGADPAAPAAPGDGAAGDPGDGRAPRDSRRAVWRAARRGLGGRHVGGPVELLAVLLLVGGGLLGELIAMAGGWLLAYWAPRIGRTEAKWAVFGMPALVASGYLIWLYGRVNEQWGDPLEAEAMTDAFTANVPLVVRAAAVASALFILWRGLRRPAEKK